MQISLQAKLFDFALSELVIQHRESFKPLWTVDSWVKFLIWMALNCGLSGDRDSLEVFAGALGAKLSKRMRRLFFERVLDNPSLHIIADPAEKSVFIMQSNGSSQVNYEQSSIALNQLNLIDRLVSDKKQWQELDSGLSIPWLNTESTS